MVPKAKALCGDDVRDRVKSDLLRGAVPVCLLFLMQKHFVAGLTTGAVKA